MFDSSFDNDSDDDFDGMSFWNDLDGQREDDYGEIDPEESIRKSIGKTISTIRFEMDEDLLEVLYLEFSDQSTLILRCSRKRDESIIFVEEESFPQFIGAKVLDVEVFEDYSGDDIFNADLEYIVFKTDKGELTIDFENGGKLIGETDDFDKYEADYQSRKQTDNSSALTAIIALYWLGYFD